MKKLCLLGALALLVFSPAAFANMAPSHWVVIPEVIWAEASGGGTWVTSLQVTAKAAATDIYINFFYQNSNVWRWVSFSSITNAHQTLRWDNVLQSIGLVDTAFAYYGRVGTLLVYGQDDSHRIWAQALTTNGNYGKSFPSFVWTDTTNTAGAGRYMVIPGIQNTATFRTGCGFWNSSDDATRVVRFYVMNPSSYLYLGTYFDKTFQPNGFMSFNPFIDSGLLSTNVPNSWLLIWQQSITGTESEGLFCFGSLANNYTNDTYTLIAQPFQ